MLQNSIEPDEFPTGENLISSIYLSAVKFLYPLPLTETYEMIVNEAIRLVKAESGSVFIFENNELNRVYSTLPRKFQIQPRPKGFTHQALVTKKTVVVPEEKFSAIHPQIKSRHTKSIVLIPLTNRNKSFGVVSIGSKEKAWINEDKVNILTLFGSIAALAIVKARLNKNLEDAVTNRDLFISLAGHELKNPVTALKGFSQLIFNKVIAGEKAPLTWYQRLYNGIEMLSRLITELFELNQIRAGKIRYLFRPFSFGEIVNLAVSETKLIHPDNKIIVKYGSANHSDMITGDSSRLFEVVNNLLNNAAKYSPEGSDINVYYKIDKGLLTFSVSDHGRGIKKEYISKIFNEFYRIPGQKGEGLGLGLFITKNIVDAHKGKIRISSKPSHGTKFTVILPTKPS